VLSGDSTTDGHVTRATAFSHKVRAIDPVPVLWVSLARVALLTLPTGSSEIPRARSTPLRVCRRLLSWVEVLAFLLVAHGASGQDGSGTAPAGPPGRGADLSEFRMSLDLTPSIGAPRRRPPYRGADLSEFRMSLDAAPAPGRGSDLSEFRMSLDAGSSIHALKRETDLSEFRTTF
jgi:hypothetical protein